MKPTQAELSEAGISHPCPKCEGIEVELRTYSLAGKRYRLECAAEGCDARTEHKLTPEFAEAAWRGMVGEASRKKQAAEQPTTEKEKKK